MAFTRALPKNIGFLFYLETKARFDRQLKQRLEKEAEAAKLSTDIERLQSTCFTTPSSVQTGGGDENSNSAASVRPYLTKAIGEIRAASQRIR